MLPKFGIHNLLRNKNQAQINAPCPAVVSSDPRTGELRFEDCTIQPQVGMYGVLSLNCARILVRYEKQMPVPVPPCLNEGDSSYNYVKPKPAPFEVEPGTYFTLFVGNTHFVARIAQVLSSSRLDSSPTPTSQTIDVGTTAIKTPGRANIALPALKSSAQRHSPLRHEKVFSSAPPKRAITKRRSKELPSLPSNDSTTVLVHHRQSENGQQVQSFTLHSRTPHTLQHDGSIKVTPNTASPAPLPSPQRQEPSPLPNKSHKRLAAQDYMTDDKLAAKRKHRYSASFDATQPVINEHRHSRANSAVSSTRTPNPNYRGGSPAGATVPSTRTPNASSEGSSRAASPIPSTQSTGFSYMPSSRQSSIKRTRLQEETGTTLPTQASKIPKDIRFNEDTQSRGQPSVYRSPSQSNLEYDESPSSENPHSIPLPQFLVIPPISVPQFEEHSNIPFPERSKLERLGHFDQKVQEYTSLARDGLPVNLQPQNKQPLVSRSVHQNLHRKNRPTGDEYDRAPRNQGAAPIPPSETVAERPQRLSSPSLYSQNIAPPTSELLPLNGDEYEEVGNKNANTHVPVGAERNPRRRNDAGASLVAPAAPALAPPPHPPGPAASDRIYSTYGTGRPMDTGFYTGHPKVMERVWSPGVVERAPFKVADPTKYGIITPTMACRLWGEALVGQQGVQEVQVIAAIKADQAEWERSKRSTMRV